MSLPTTKLRRSCNLPWLTRTLPFLTSPFLSLSHQQSPLVSSSYILSPFVSPLNSFLFLNIPLPSIMKLAIKSINPKNLFCSKKPSSLSKSEPLSFSPALCSCSSSSSSSSCSSDHGGRKGYRSTTPTSVLKPTRSLSPEISGELSDTSARVGCGDTYRELVEAFKLIDHDGDGKITRREMESLLSRIARFGTAAGPSEDEIATMLSEIDRDGDGCISFEEFGVISEAFGPATGADELRGTFDVFDADHDGKITAEELLSVFLAIGDARCTLEDCRRMIQSVDTNGDGVVCFEDFSRMMDHQCYQRC